MRIQHNILAMNAYRNYSNNTSALGKNLERLSSGYRINRAGDDAAGLAISEKMRAQITGLNAAQKNVKDGISLVKTAEGAMQEVQDMLNRMVYLSTQSANGTYDDDTDRAALQQEVDALREEINRISDSANFNGIKLLDGSLDAGKEAELVAGSKTVWTDQAMNAVGKKVTESIDGKAPTPATKATFTLTFDETFTKPTSVGGLTDLGGGAKVTAIFDIYNEDGSKVTDLSTISVDAGKTGTLTFVAKTAGAFSDDDWDTFLDSLEGITGVVSVDATNGTDVGGGASSPATKAKYEYTFDFSQIEGGESFTFNGMTFTFDKDITGGTSGYDTVSDDNGDTIGYKIGLAGLDLSDEADQKKLAQAIWAALDDSDAVDNGTTFSINHSTAAKAAAAIKDGKLTIKITAENKGVVGNVDNATFQNGKSDAITVSAIYGQEAKTGTGGGQAVTVRYNADLKNLQAGDKISIGGVELEIVEDEDGNDTANGKITESFWKEVLDRGDDGLHQLLKAAGYDESMGNVTYNGTILTITKTTADDTTAAEWAKGLGSFKMGETVVVSEEEVAAAAQAGKALNLQIGDTSDSWNQMKISIGDIHTKAMGTTDEDGNVTTSIDDIDITTAESAQTAVNVIKDAINYVSSVRGQLGAYQNRLEHTQNNLSVMAENIQDAESSIRDTDVAEEMMAYVKNNILVQSAQAMLAQANQVPQGVLQLLG